MRVVAKTAVVIKLLATAMGACQTRITPISLPDAKTTPPVSQTIAQPAAPSYDCPSKPLALNLLGSWTFTSNYLSNTTKHAGRIVFKVDTSFEDPDSLFGHQLQNEAILARLYELRGDTLRVYITDKLERQQGVILVLRASDCDKLRFVGIGKGGNFNVELAR